MPSREYLSFFDSLDGDFVPSMYPRRYDQELYGSLFGAANFHFHGNGRQLLPEVARLRGTIAVTLGNDGSDETALDAAWKLNQQAGHLAPVIPCGLEEFRAKLREGELPGGLTRRVASP